MSDPLRTLLDELAPDVSRTRLADPSAVRRRGEQRTHRKIAGAAVVGGAAVIAAALLGTGPLRSLADNTEPATSPTPAVSASTSPSASTSAARTIHLLAASALPKSDQGSWRALSTALTGGDVNRCLDTLPAGATTYERWFSTTASPKPADEVAVHRVGRSSPRTPTPTRRSSRRSTRSRLAGATRMTRPPDQSRSAMTDTSSMAGSTSGSATP